MEMEGHLLLATLDTQKDTTDSLKRAQQVNEMTHTHTHTHTHTPDPRICVSYSMHVYAAGM